MKAPLILIVLIVIGVPAWARSLENLPAKIEPTRMMFPREPALRGVDTGYAKVAVEIGADGQLVDFLVTACSGQAFAEEAGKLLRTARYTAATTEGHPVPARVEVVIHFETSGVLVTSDFNEIVDSYLRGRRGLRDGFQLGKPAELDQPLLHLQPVPPVFPTTLAEQGMHGTAEIDFFIDQEGKVRLPAVVRADYRELGNLAIDAVAQWQFAPPRSFGEPVVVHVRQVFEFRPPTPR